MREHGKVKQIASYVTLVVLVAVTISSIEQATDKLTPESPTNIPRVFAIEFEYRLLTSLSSIA